MRPLQMEYFLKISIHLEEENMIGHTNVKTTQNYPAGFEDESKKEAIKALTAFRGT